MFAGMTIDKACFVVEYRGEIISQEESQKRQKGYSEIENTFLFDFDWRRSHWWYVLITSIVSNTMYIVIYVN